MKIRIILLLLSVIILVVLTGCDSSKPKTSGQSMESLTLGFPEPDDLGSLIWVAEHHGFFSERGVKIDIKRYESGLAAVKDLLAGKLDLAIATDFVAARHILERSDIRLICSMCEIDGDSLNLAARKDHGITQLSDIRNKRIGLTRGSISDFALDLLLVLENIPAREIERVDLSAPEQVKAISEGKVDAVVVWEPFYSRVCNELGANLFSCSTQGVQNYYWLLLSTPQSISKRSHAINSFVAALVSAGEVIKNRREDCKRMVAQKLGERHFDYAWDGTQFTVGLDDSLDLLLKAEMRWMRPDVKTKDPAVLDILPYIYFDALKSVQPEKIKILH